jgi:hypothetical protein
VQWGSCLSKRPVKSAGSAEILAASAGADEGKLLASVYSILLNVCVDLVLCVDSKSLWDSISTCHEPIDRSIRPDVALLRYDFERRALHELVWIPGTINPADALTKENSSVTPILQIIMQEGTLAIDVDKTKRRAHNLSLG